MISPHFHHTNSTREQSLTDDLSREAIYLKGLDFLYIPRDATNVDDLFGEVNQETYQAGVTIEMYPNEMTGFEGDGDFFSQFGLDIRDECTFDVNKNRFETVVSAVYDGIKRPREGDLIYYELAKALFEITHVEKEKPFYPRGVQPTWVISSKRFEYNHDIMNSGETAVDDLETDIELFDDSADVQTESDQITDFDETDPFSDNDY